jgi:hypothetical protein
MEEKIGIIALLCGILALILALSGLLPINYNELEGTPDFSGYANMTDIPQSFPYANITEIPNIDLQHGLCLWLPFDGVALDKSGYCNNGIVFGTTYADGKFNKALSFDGINDYVKILHSPILELTINFSITAWIEIPVHNNYRFIVVKGYTNVPRPYEFRVNPLGQLELMLFDTTYRSYIDPTAIPTDEFVFVVVTKEKGAKVCFYINGILDKELDEGNINQVSNTDDILIGTRNDTYTYFNGIIDDVRIYNRVLNQDEINALFTLGI